MKTTIHTIGSLLCLLLLCVNVSLAQDEEPIRADWLATDVANIERILPQLKFSEPLTPAKLKAIFGDNFSETDLGFGGRKFTFSKPGGYTYLRVNGFAFNDTIGEYEISLESHSTWPTVKSVLTEAWKRSSDLQFKQWKYGIDHQQEFPDVLADFKKGINSKLGQLKLVSVPPHLKDAYEELVSLGKNSTIGSSGCGFGGAIPAGKKAIDALVRANRLDLVGNILKGYNPGGRVYAALVLIGMQRKGSELPHDLLQALEIVRNMDLELETCSGCIVSHKTAKQIIADWPF